MKLMYAGLCILLVIFVGCGNRDTKQKDAEHLLASARDFEEELADLPRAIARYTEIAEQFPGAVAEKARDNTGVYFAVDTLEFLHRGGRIGGAKRLMGTAMKVKPILSVQEGLVASIESVRTKKKAHLRVLEIIKDEIGDRTPIHLATLNANATEDAQALLKLAQQEMDVAEVIHSEVSPVIGTHVGPGTVGLAYMAGL